MSDNGFNHNFPAHTKAGDGPGGTLPGALVIVVLYNIMSLRNIASNLQQALKGALLIAALFLRKRQDK